ncbi:thiamine pyrophosphokinase [Aulographum hederae CBS 113979]|uniref:Thiamine pyrophosphokinase n=1 Tax=Aulographum hederae CBS 113979 TaxID=1176131 RepID=A0A6G1GN05_9PEZI|nr:thiamine pyrophosphokinase [Aulographum hederae CBS 113979]
MPEGSLKSNLDLVNECDCFPYIQVSPSAYLSAVSTLYHLRCSTHAQPEVTLGYLLPSVALTLQNIPGWEVSSSDADPRTITLVHGEDEPSRSAIVAATTSAMKATGHFKVLEKWRNELYPVVSPDRTLLFSIERSASPLFGIVSHGVHMTCYTRSKQADGKDDYKIWVARRARSKQTYGGMLDNAVAGGTATGEVFFESIIRESAEEASLSPDLVRTKAKPCGTVSYFYIRDRRAGGETGLMQPEVQFLYDLELDDSVVPKPSDDEVEGFFLWSIEEVQESMRRGEWKPNCAIVMLDWLVRHGILTAENEPKYSEIVSRIHRRLEFPSL